MDKLKRVLSGNDDSPNDENRGIMGDVCGTFLFIRKILILCSVYIFVIAIVIERYSSEIIRLKAIRTWFWFSLTQ